MRKFFQASKQGLGKMSNDILNLKEKRHVGEHKIFGLSVQKEGLLSLSISCSDAGASDS